MSKTLKLNNSIKNSEILRYHQMLFKAFTTSFKQQTLFMFCKLKQIINGYNHFYRHSG